MLRQYRFGPATANGRLKRHDFPGYLLREPCGQRYLHIRFREKSAYDFYRFALFDRFQPPMTHRHLSAGQGIPFLLIEFSIDVREIVRG
jgi:hypothetical protein